MRELNGDTKICVVIGDPISHSLSPCLHNAAYEAAGLEGRFIFVACRVLSESLKDAIKGVRSLNFRGVSVTLPHKTAIVSYLDDVHVDAKGIGAINTVVNDHGKLTGYNTDINGILIPIEKRTSLHGKRVALFGAGGAARSVVHVAKSRSADVTIINRDAKRGEALASEFKCAFLSLESAKDLSEFDVLINATSVGMSPKTEESVIPASALLKSHLVFDLVYTPRETKLIRDALAVGAGVIYGSEMFLHQAAAQFELFTGSKAPIEEMRRFLHSRLGASK